LLFGEYAQIISPPELKELVKRNMAAILKKLSSPGSEKFIFTVDTGLSLPGRYFVFHQSKIS